MKKSLIPIVIITGFLAFAIIAAAGPPDSPEKLSADSTMKDPYNRYDVSHLVDRTWASWCEGEKGDGAGTKITFGYNWSVQLDALFVKNGFGLRKYFGLNNRVKKMKITGDTGSSTVVTLVDRPDVQKLSLSPPLSGKSFIFEIMEVYKGSKYNDTCIAEIAFAPVEIKDTEEMPRFKSLTFMMPEGQYGGRIITLLADGGVKGEHSRGHQCSTTIVSGSWKKNPDGSVRIDYIWEDPVNCGEMEGEIKTEQKKSFLVLKRFGIDGIIDAAGNRAREISWE